MVVSRRASAQQPLNDPSISGYGTVDSPSDAPSKPLTITYAESLRDVPWQTDNDHILTGYRRQLYTYKACIKSAFTCESFPYSLLVAVGKSSLQLRYP